MKEELVTIIIPVYNIFDYIERCVKSVIIQSYTNLEIILVDDGSTDGSGQICDQYARLDKRVKVFHKENGGLSDARNYGIDRCHGAYIMFLDGDDWVESTIVEELYAVHQNAYVDFVQCQFMYAYENGEKKYLDVNQQKLSFYSRNEAIKSFVESGPQGVSVAVWAKLYRREVFRRVRYPKGKVHEDVFAMCDIVFSDISKVAVLNKPLYNYLQREGSISNSVNYKRLKDQLACQVYVKEHVDMYTPQFKLEANKILYDIIIDIVHHISPADLKVQSEFLKKIQISARKVPIHDLKKCGYKLRLRFYFKIIQWNLPLYIKLRGRKNGIQYT